MAKVTLIGHVGNDIIVQSGTSGRDYVRFSLACRDGPDRTNWFRVVNFNPKATAFMLASVKKGGALHMALVFSDSQQLAGLCRWVNTLNSIHNGRRQAAQ
ncbi:uncharacterized protein T551_02749 [Pneumocystis jirovecii RU7]|uniref:Single-stranded DNA-binding protein n=1 Tax=Pneumocystis jirovecii (strain RU7) TaxID=1408657 RepID=A0A0W4ZIZ7_PNEJ7|nr:uncharacterized protein T551_02749 [Pneumocystis jirovecii RU7]KTW28330.1 hypothetical protein T551_02749 [Pneumocystis jirovecii RU7]